MATTYAGGGNGIFSSRASITYYDPTTEGSVDASITNLLGGAKWGGAIGAGVSLTTSFSNLNSTYDYSTGDTEKVVPLLSTQIAAARKAMAGWAAVAKISFTEITDSASNAGDIRWGQSTDYSNPTAYAWYPSVYPEGGDIWFGPNYSSYYNNPVAGSYGYQTYVHELGHALGLGHPHDGDVAPVPGEDQLKYSVMSYRSYNGDDLTGYSNAFYPTSPMLNDILAIQFLYGANMSYKTGNDTYSWDAGKSIFETIWDAGGTDTLDGSNQSQAVIFDLRSGYWSSIGVSFWNGQSYVRDCLTIAYGATIENATGSAFNDTLIGNDAANVLNGRTGADSMQGGLGNDSYYVDNAADTVTETSALTSEIDTVYASVSWTLADNLEKLVLSGSCLINATGNALANTLIGNSAANVLDGGAGADTMQGGLGNDSYYVDNAADTVSETSSLTSQVDTVYASVSWTLGANLERLTLLGGSTINATGNGRANTLIGNSAANVLNGGTRADSMQGGLGDDIYYVDNTGDTVIETSGLASEIDTVYASISWTLGANIERLSLLGGNAINATGNALANTLIGNSAANVLKGGGEADTMQGGTGNDRLFGGTGNDSLTGDAGADIFVFDTALSATDNVDEIADFSTSLDRIWLDQTIFTRLSVTGTLSSLLFRASADGLAIDQNDYILYNTTSGALMYDADGAGAGAGIQFLTLTTKPSSITASDFMIVA
jgi:serralysin